jgi:hypothetical protein
VAIGFGNYLNIEDSQWVKDLNKEITIWRNKKNNQINSYM